MKFNQEQLEALERTTKVVYKEMMRIYCDSSTKEACLVIEGQPPIITPYPAPVTNNVGEYQAVILALEEAKQQEVNQVDILTDSQLVVEQIGGHWACRQEHLKVLRKRVWELVRNLDFNGVVCNINWIPREENLAGKVLG